MDSREKLPFYSYPGGGRILMEKLRGGDCRHGYGYDLMRITDQTKCAYCGLDFTKNCENWLQLMLDHVVPRKTGRERGIRLDWLDNGANKVPACPACNGYLNRFQLDGGSYSIRSLDEFFNLRDKVFLDRKTAIQARKNKEAAFFKEKIAVLNQNLNTSFPIDLSEEKSNDVLKHESVEDISQEISRHRRRIIKFLDADEQYAAFVQSSGNQSGVVLNTFRTPRSNDLVIHRLSCPKISDRPSHGKAWTSGDYCKIWAATIEELEDWTLENLGSHPTFCKICKPDAQEGRP